MLNAHLRLTFVVAEVPPENACQAATLDLCYLIDLAATDVAANLSTSKSRVEIPAAYR